MVQSLFGHSRVSVLYLTSLVGGAYYIFYRLMADTTQASWTFAHQTWLPMHWLDIALGTLFFVMWPVVFNHSLIYNLKLYKSTGYPTLMGLLIGALSLVFVHSAIELLVLLVSFYMFLRIITQWDVFNQSNRAFALGALSGILFLIFPPAAVLLLLLLFSFLIYGRIDIRLFLLTLFATLLPIYFAGGIFYLMDAYAEFWHWLRFALMPQEGYNFNIAMAIAAVASLGWLLLSLKDFFTAVSRAKIIKRNALTLALVTLILVIATAVYLGQFRVMYLAVLPLSLLSANFMQYLRKRFWLNLWTGLTLLVIVAQWFFMD